MRLFFLTAFVFFSFALQPFKLLSNSNEAPQILVAILQNASFFDLESQAGFLIADPKTGTEKTFSNKTILRIEPNSSGLLIGTEQWGPEVKAMPANGDPLSVNGILWSGTLLIKKNDLEHLTVINAVSLDSYLYGVLPKEVHPNWPSEALKAQALISRTFALKNLGHHQSEGFDFCNKDHCQVYGGKSCESETTNEAVDSTREEVIAYKGKLIFSVFSSNCGGSTAKSGEVWEGVAPLPYLRPVQCRYCRDNPSYIWKRLITEAQIARALNKMGVEVQSPIQSISIQEYGNSGRAKFFRIKDANGNTRVRASHLRLAIGAENFRSTFLKKIEKSKDGFMLTGRGWGHGVGLCQDGAKGMARLGKNYRQIIQFYYPGAKVVRWDQAE